MINYPPKRLKKRILHTTGLLIGLALALASCSTNKNTAITRFYHSMTTRYNVYFNGEAYYGQLQSEISGMSAEEWAKIRTCEWNGSEASAEMRRTTVNFLEFALDHFYGLKDYKNIGTFGEDVIAGDLRTALLSGDAATHNQAYIDLFQKTLNEMHTTLISPSFFAEANGQFDLNGENAGSALTSYMTLFNELSANMVNSVAEVVQMPDGSMGMSIPAVRFEGDTAVIMLSSFSVGADDLIADRFILHLDSPFPRADRRPTG